MPCDQPHGEEGRVSPAKLVRLVQLPLAPFESALNDATPSSYLETVFFLFLSLPEGIDFFYFYSTTWRKRGLMNNLTKRLLYLIN